MRRPPGARATRCDTSQPRFEPSPRARCVAAASQHNGRAGRCTRRRPTPSQRWMAVGRPSWFVTRARGAAQRSSRLSIRRRRVTIRCSRGWRLTRRRCGASSCHASLRATLTYSTLSRIRLCSTRTSSGSSSTASASSPSPRGQPRLHRLSQPPLRRKSQPLLRLRSKPYLRRKSQPLLRLRSQPHLRRWDQPFLRRRSQFLPRRWSRLSEHGHGFHQERKHSPPMAVVQWTIVHNYSWFSWACIYTVGRGQGAR